MVDRWGEKQSVVIPEINDKFIGIKTEMLFNYTHDQGLSWYHGEVIAINRITPIRVRAGTKKSCSIAFL